MMWASGRKRRRVTGDVEEEEDEDDDMSGGLKTGHCLYVLNNHVHFNYDVTQQSMFLLGRTLRNLAQKLKLNALRSGAAAVQPIYLHVSTDGGEVSAAFSVVACIAGLGVDVYSVVDGFVASAGTLITLAAKKRYIQPNAYMLIHQVSSGVWGKMSVIDEQVDNLKKLMQHITAFYLKHTSLKAPALKKLLLTDVTWNAEESIVRGIADELYQ